MRTKNPQKRRSVLEPRLPAIACALTSILAVVPSAWAQGDQTDAAASAQGVAELPAVTVTARKREESEQKVPISMTVLDGKTIETGASPSDSNAGLARSAPNTSFADSGGQFGNLFLIRGVGSFAPLSPDDTSVVTYFNEVPRSVYGAPPTLFDIERVEVLRGPQGTLFGRNTQGGAINIVPNAPSFKREFSATTEIGTHGYHVGEAVANGALSDTLAGRLALRYSDQSGTVPNIASGGKDGKVQVGSARGSLLWLIGDDTTATLTGYYDRRESNAPRFVWYQNPDFPQSAVDPDGNITWRDAGVSLKVEHDFGKVRLTSLTSYQDDYSHQPLDLTDGLIYSAMTRQSPSLYNVPYADLADITFREKTTQQEFRLSSNDDGPFTWTGGINFFRSEFTNNAVSKASAAAFNYQTQNGTQHNRITTNSAALFGEGTLALTDKLKATLGLRYTYEHKDAGYEFIGNGSPAVVGYSDHDSSLSDRFPTGRAGLSYDWSPNVMTYATVSRGAVSSGYPVTQTNGPYGKAEVPYPRSTSWTYEAGFKSYWLDRRLSVNGSVFYNDVKNGHLIVFDASQALFTTAALDYRSKGFELETAASLTQNLKLTAGIGYTDAELVHVPTGSSTGAASGNRVPNVPKVNASLGVQYDTPMNIAGYEGTLKTSVAWQYVGNRAADVKGSFELPSYSVTNARIGWQHGNWEIYGFAWNLFNKQYFVAGQAWTTGVSSVRIGQPRIVGVGATIKF
ncbi:TonB-dependent receptor [Bordetella genomosp. 10]|uniref:TonB-dependent receptor n=1 Tax=Bordetella genomosp. 10 TaxID=1416804 RepID=A0A261SB24_9BORD|nr:TonB-dependent receptor [Bordetella genomosp. 10]OZI34187.1 TonB-dependent receptor [Bordetella genomosp. 10]